MVGYSGNKEGIEKRLKRIEGQVRGLQRMIDEERLLHRCPDSGLGNHQGPSGCGIGAAERPPVALCQRGRTPGRKCC
jgi:hypothetical protein